MATLPEDIKNNILKLAKKLDEDPKILMNRLKEIIQTDETIQTMKKPEHKIRFGWSKLYGEYSLSGNVKSYYIRPIIRSRPRRVEIKGDPTWVGDIVCLAQLIGKDKEGNEKLGEPLYCSGTLWRDAAKNSRSLEPGKVYRAMLEITENSWGAKVSGNKTTFQEVKNGYTLPKFEEFYKNEIEPKGIAITIEEMDINSAKFETDIRTIEVMVVEAEVGESSSGNEYGRFTVMDESIIGGNHTIFVSPEDVIWAQGSTLIFGGKIDASDDTKPPKWNNHFILPTDLAMSREIQVKSAKEKDTVNVSDEEDEDEKDEESKTEDPEEKEEKEETKEEPKSEKKEEVKETSKEEVKEEKSNDDEGDIFKIDT